MPRVTVSAAGERVAADYLAAFVLRETKPIGGKNVGAGIIRPLKDGWIDSSNTGYGTWANGILKPNRPLVDVKVLGMIDRSANDFLIENVYVRADPRFPVSGGRSIVQCGGTYTGQGLMRYVTISGSYRTPLLNGFGGRNMRLECVDIHHVTDGISPSPGAGNLDANLDLAGCHVHDHAFYAPDPSHSATPDTVADGSKVTGPWKGVGWNHCDGLQLQTTGITGIRSIGNHYDARWATDDISVLPLPPVRKQLSALMLNAGKDLVFEDDWYNGGEHCINNGATTVTGWIKRGKFGPDLLRNAGGPLALMLASKGLLTYDGTPDQSVLESTGEPVKRRMS